MSLQIHSGCPSEGNRIINLKRFLPSHVHRSVAYNSQDVERTCLSRDKWKDNEDVRQTDTHTQNYTIQP